MNKIIQKILTLLPNSTRDPFFILKGSGEILHTNMQGSELLNISESPGNITDYFQVDTKKRFNELLDQAVETNNLITIDHLELELITGSRIKTQLILNIFEDKNDLIVFCTIIPKQYSVELKKNSRIKIQEADIQKIIKSESTLELLNKVESLFPFTFIGKEIMHKIIDTIDEVFWITDNEGRFILVNDYFAEAMGLKPFQMEGKLAEVYIPGYLKELDSLIEKFIKETISSVVLEGIKFREIENLKNREIIQVPLFDEEKNIEAIIGISQQKELD
ncbi:MAG: PAS domain S-box protein, partial [Bacteroidetes bacterium]|nr:PAS domain S-box protein [Bacteroidota bacterium]